jgi:hypothetical protein
MSPIILRDTCWTGGTIRRFASHFERSGSALHVCRLVSPSLPLHLTLFITTMLCNVCLGIFQHRNEFDDQEVVRRYKRRAWNLSRGRQWSFGHHLSSISLMHSATLGCYICATLWGRISRNDQRSIHTWEKNNGHLSQVESSEAGTKQVVRSDFFTQALISTGRSKSRSESFRLSVNVCKGGMPHFHNSEAYFSAVRLSGKSKMI